MTRRALLGGLAAIVVAAAGGAAWKLNLFGRHYPPTPYDDLLNQIVDREQAARVGAVVAKTRPGLTVQSLAATLRQPGRRLSLRALSDAEHSRLIEADGWVLPESVGLYAALAAKL